MSLQSILPQYMDSTMLTCFRSCPEKFRNEFCFGLRPEGLSIDLHAGGCFATALEVCRKAIFAEGKSLTDALQVAHAAFAVAWGNFEIPEYKKTAKTFDNTWAAVERYFAKWPPLTDHVQPYYINGVPTFEHTFAIPLEPVVAHDFSTQSGAEGYASYDPDHYVSADGTHRPFPLHPSGDPFLYSGRFDFMGSYLKRPVVADDKTTGRSISSGWAEQWNLRNQFMGYVWACQQSGIALDTVVIRGVAIQVKGTGLEEAIKPYSDFKLNMWHEQLRRDMWRLRRSWDTGYFDLNLGDTCISYGNCIFMDICGSPDKPSWMNQFQVRRWNPLLKNPVQEAQEAA